MSTKLLCLHGYTQNGNLFSKRIGVLRKKLLKHNIECFFPTGIHKPSSSFSTNSDEVETCWWNSNENYTKYHGLEDSVSYLKQYMEENGPFHGILGFSQGALMAAIIASVVEPKVDYLVVVSGFMPRAQNAIDALSFAGPALHVIGLKDEIIKPDISNSLVTYLSTAYSDEAKGTVQVLEHDGGHFVPGKSEYITQIVAWIVSHSNAGSKL
jgi:predicted esterase